MNEEQVEDSFRIKRRVLYKFGRLTGFKARRYYTVENSTFYFYKDLKAPIAQYTINSLHTHIRKANRRFSGFEASVSILFRWRGQKKKFYLPLANEEEAKFLLSFMEIADLRDHEIDDSSATHSYALSLRESPITSSWMEMKNSFRLPGSFTSRRQDRHYEPFLSVPRRRNEAKDVSKEDSLSIAFDGNYIPLKAPRGEKPLLCFESPRICEEDEPVVIEIKPEEIIIESEVGISDLFQNYAINRIIGRDKPGSPDGIILETKLQSEAFFNNINKGYSNSKVSTGGFPRVDSREEGPSNQDFKVTNSENDIIFNHIEQKMNIVNKGIFTKFSSSKLSSCIESIYSLFESYRMKEAKSMALELKLNGNPWALLSLVERDLLKLIISTEMRYIKKIKIKISKYLTSLSNDVRYSRCPEKILVYSFLSFYNGALLFYEGAKLKGVSAFKGGLSSYLKAKKLESTKCNWDTPQTFRTRLQIISAFYDLLALYIGPIMLKFLSLISVTLDKERGIHEFKKLSRYEGYLGKYSLIVYAMLMHSLRRPDSEVIDTLRSEITQNSVIFTWVTIWILLQKKTIFETDLPYSMYCTLPPEFREKCNSIKFGLMMNSLSHGRVSLSAQLGEELALRCCELSPKIKQQIQLRGEEVNCHFSSNEQGVSTSNLDRSRLLLPYVCEVALLLKLIYKYLSKEHPKNELKARFWLFVCEKLLKHGKYLHSNFKQIEATSRYTIKNINTLSLQSELTPMGPLFLYLYYTQILAAIPIDRRAILVNSSGVLKELLSGPQASHSIFLRLVLTSIVGLPDIVLHHEEAEDKEWLSFSKLERSHLMYWLGRLYSKLGNEDLANRYLTLAANQHLDNFDISIRAKAALETLRMTST